MRLYIAEKPSLGRAIADVLPKPHRKEDGCIWVGNGDVVSWCIGHLLEQAEPEAYSPEFKAWNFDYLPIVPTLWKLQPKVNTRKQLNVLSKLVKAASTIVHAGDPDREGQLLVDQVIDYLKVTNIKHDTIQRCLINDLNPAAVARALSTLRPNRDFIPLSTSALARSRADWLYGINMTRAYTLQGRKVGYGGLLSVGRVQTPVLGMVVRRDQQIEAFVPKPFYEVLGHIHSGTERFSAKWQPSDACEPYMDEEGRVIFKKLAETVVAKITNKPGAVTEVKRKQKSQPPPLPYSLSALQIDAAKRFGMSAKHVLDACQALYERHKLITYPRSDSRYLPVEHLKQAKAVLNAVASNLQGRSIQGHDGAQDKRVLDQSAPKNMAAYVQGANTQLKSKAWNDAKVDAHHAIIPTAKKQIAKSLSAAEANLYEMIARQYVAQFYPPWLYCDTAISLVIEGGLFVAKARNTQALGWKVLFPKKTSSTDKKKQCNTAEDDTLDEFPENRLPDLKKGDAVHCAQGELLEKSTQPPKYFTDATLLAAMTGISRYVSDPDIKKILKETDGLGTEATRAGIIELLFQRQFLARQGKQIHSTPAARALVASLPLSATTPDMTAQWECALNNISQAQSCYQDFMGPMVEVLHQLIAQSQHNIPQGLKGLPAQKPKTFRSKSRGFKAKQKPAAKRSTAEPKLKPVKKRKVGASKA